MEMLTVVMGVMRLKKCAVLSQSVTMMISFSASLGSVSHLYKDVLVLRSARTGRMSLTVVREKVSEI